MAPKNLFLITRKDLFVKVGFRANYIREPLWSKLKYVALKSAKMLCLPFDLAPMQWDYWSDKFMRQMTLLIKIRPEISLNVEVDRSSIRVVSAGDWKEFSSEQRT